MLNLSSYNQSDKQIAEIKNMYKHTTLEDQQIKHKNNYITNLKTLTEKSQQELLSDLLPVSSSSKSNQGLINTTAFYNER